MAVDQDWPSVYPVAAPFKPSVVPLPVRMGYPVKKGVPMAKEGNLELLKVSGVLAQTSVSACGSPAHARLLPEFTSSLLIVIQKFFHGIMQVSPRCQDSA